MLEQLLLDTSLSLFSLETARISAPSVWYDMGMVWYTIVLYYTIPYIYHYVCLRFMLGVLYMLLLLAKLEIALSVCKLRDTKAHETVLTISHSYSFFVTNQ